MAPHRPPDSRTLGRDPQSPVRPALPSLLGALLALVPPAESQPVAAIPVLKLGPPGLHRHFLLPELSLPSPACVAGWLLTSFWPWVKRCALRVCPDRIPRRGLVHFPSLPRTYFPRDPQYKSLWDICPPALIGSSHHRR